MVLKPKQSYLKLGSLIGLLALPVLSTPVFAEEFLCDATQASTNELPVLDKACPIGKGLWGKTKPRGSESTFWIQCGVFGQPLSVAKAKKLYQHISTDVWAKAEGKANRCLIGPYTDFAQAKQDLANVKTEPGYKEAFIREVVKGAVSPAPVKPVAKKVSRTSTQATTVIPAPVKSQPTPVVTATESKKAQPQQEITIRLSTSVSGVEYNVPYLMFSDDQFYMEHSLPWNRMSYEAAYKTCYRLGMKLATTEQWQALLASGEMEKSQWPMHLPYWGAEKVGMFTSGKTNQLKGSSLLNIMCVK
ncbi:SPOR domain-containing protein [Vibrio aquaticus]|uniref:SPOR domain-containing protein n=1 Tax=Vibrio aquaticus TaxID=2496559 RepID=A0A3S0PM65_9VIBR|nr:SPOR domain-containing protein [Vibrio aquaticus]RTZ14246.1 SPOR domain-containing protein [Vibrio aquaticus]